MYRHNKSWHVIDNKAHSFLNGRDKRIANFDRLQKRDRGTSQKVEPERKACSLQLETER